MGQRFLRFPHLKHREKCRCEGSIVPAKRKSVTMNHIWKDVQVMFAGNIPNNTSVAMGFLIFGPKIPEKQLTFTRQGNFIR